MSIVNLIILLLLLLLLLLIIIIVFIKKTDKELSNYICGNIPEDGWVREKEDEKVEKYLVREV